MFRILGVSILAVALTGCSAGGISTPSPTPTPTPTIMTVVEAGEMYLQAVCPGNNATDKFFADINVETPDIAILKADAVSLVDAFTRGTEILDEETILWPEDIADSITTIADADYASIGWAQSMVNAETLDDFIGFTYTQPGTPESATAAQKIRARLDLTSDTKASCVGVS
jgi:hypothetical protein